MKSVKVTGMSCEHCVKAVKDALTELGLADVAVDLDSGMATFAPTDSVTAQQLEAAIDEAGYEVESVQ